MLCLGLKQHGTATISVPPSTEWTQIEVTLIRPGRHGGDTRVGFTAPRAVQIVRDDAVLQEPQDNKCSGTGDYDRSEVRGEVP